LIAVVLGLSAQPASAFDTVYWQCAKFARLHSGLAIYGDAHRWWSLAAGRFERGNRPRVGAVLAFEATDTMRLGHVATVSGILSPREIAVTHANWSPFGGRRGHIEHDVLVRDVSANNDWSAVRVWYAPIGDLGSSHYPVAGFIYGTPAAVTRHIAQPRLSYARLDTMEAMAHKPGRRPLLIGADVIRLARLERR